METKYVSHSALERSWKHLFLFVAVLSPSNSPSDVVRSCSVICLSANGKNYSPVVLVAEPLPLLAEFYKGQVRAGGEQG